MATLNDRKQQITDFILSAFATSGKEKAAGCLKYPYLSPGMTYAKDLWDWDSYWTALALIKTYEKKGDTAALEALRPHAVGSFLNFLAHQGADGALPIMITPDDPDPFDCLKSPDNNMAKPFIAQMAELLIDSKMMSTEEEFCNHLGAIHIYHNCFEKRYLDSRTGLVVYARDWGIGFDDDPTVWGRPEKSCASLFLNCFLYRDYQSAMRIAEKCKRPDYVEDYRIRCEKLKNAIQKYCWDEREKAFFSFDIQCQTRLSVHRRWGILNRNLDAFWHGIRLKVLTWSSFLPFYCGIGTKEQFDAFVTENLTEDRLMSKFGVRAVSADEAMYAPEIARGNPSNWLGPIWILANYILYQTMKDYDRNEDADKLSETIINLLADDLDRNGAFHEYYSPETGLGVHNLNFMSWTALAAIM